MTTTNYVLIGFIVFLVYKIASRRPIPQALFDMVQATLNISKTNMEIANKVLIDCSSITLGVIKSNTDLMARIDALVTADMLEARLAEDDEDEEEDEDDGEIISGGPQRVADASKTQQSNVKMFKALDNIRHEVNLRRTQLAELDSAFLDNLDRQLKL